MLKIIMNPDKEIVRIIDEALQKNGGFCPCKLEKTKDTKCICKEFREQDFPGECHCGRFIKKKK